MSQDTIRRCPATSFFFGPAVGSPTSVSATTRSNSNGTLILRHDSRLHHIGIGRRHAGTPVLVFAQDVHVEMMTDRGHPLHDLILDPRPSMSGTPLAVRWAIAGGPAEPPFSLLNFACFRSSQAVA
jgi:hypothetical protein